MHRHHALDPFCWNSNHNEVYKSKLHCLVLKQHYNRIIDTHLFFPGINSFITTSFCDERLSILKHKFRHCWIISRYVQWKLCETCLKKKLIETLTCTVIPAYKSNYKSWTFPQLWTCTRRKVLVLVPSKQNSYSYIFLVLI